MSGPNEVPRPIRCVFCRMPTPDRFLRLPMCSICRDQSYDFLLVSGVQVSMMPIVGISGGRFMMQEFSMFVVLIFVKHCITAPWQRTR